MTLLPYLGNYCSIFSRYNFCFLHAIHETAKGNGKFRLSALIYWPRLCGKSEVVGVPLGGISLPPAFLGWEAKAGKPPSGWLWVGWVGGLGGEEGGRVSWFFAK